LLSHKFSLKQKIKEVDSVESSKSGKQILNESKQKLEMIPKEKEARESV
jgi:hypothetical protein